MFFWQLRNIGKVSTECVRFFFSKIGGCFRKFLYSWFEFKFLHLTFLNWNIYELQLNMYSNYLHISGDIRFTYLFDNHKALFSNIRHPSKSLGVCKYNELLKLAIKHFSQQNVRLYFHWTPEYIEHVYKIIVRHNSYLTNCSTLLITFDRKAFSVSSHKINLM